MRMGICTGCKHFACALTRETEPEGGREGGGEEGHLARASSAFVRSPIVPHSCHNTHELLCAFVLIFQKSTNLPAHSFIHTRTFVRGFL